MRRLLYIASTILFFEICATAADVNGSFSLVEPGAVAIRNTTDASQNEWLVSNSSYAVAGIMYANCDGAARLPDNPSNLASPVRSVKSVQASFPVERNAPQYYLGDTLDVPDGVDWNATFELFNSMPEVHCNYLFDSLHRRIYVIAGGTAQFSWVVDGDGGKVTNRIVTVSQPISSSRPKRIFLTDAQYGGEPVSLTGKFAKLYGPSNILTVVEEEVDLGISIGGAPSTEKKIVSGLYISEDISGTRTMYAAGNIKGQVLMVYYDSSDYQHIVDTQVIEVLAPVVSVQDAFVGEPLKPSGNGFDGERLFASPYKTDDPGDGAYLYKYEAKHSYSPSDGCVYALRPTSETTRNWTKICWKEKDRQGVDWPFEINEYNVRWPENCMTFVRGDDGEEGAGITIPGIYSAELCGFQEDTGSVSNHARAVENNVFKTYGPGYSLLKLTANDDIWFLPVRSVSRSDREWFTGETVKYFVGEELVPRGGSLSGVAEGKSLTIAVDKPGYVHESASAKLWNPNLYSAEGVGSTGLPSAIFPVSAPMSDEDEGVIEVWWMSKFEKPQMPEPVYAPAVPQRYSIRWPGAMDAPEIVLASQEGAKGKSLHGTGGAVMFDGTGSHVKLPVRKFFGECSGTVGFWTKSYVDAAPTNISALVSFGSTNNMPLISFEVDGRGDYLVRFGHEIEFRHESQNHTEWTYLSLSWTNDIVSSMMISASTNSIQSRSVEHPGYAGMFAGIMRESVIGARPQLNAAPSRVVDELRSWNRMFTPRQMLEKYSGYETERGSGQTLHMAFVPGADLILTEDASTRYAYDLAYGSRQKAHECLAFTPGAPAIKSGLIVSDTMPVIYRQPDVDATGYNPNEEHAFVLPDADGYNVWAFRCDLNDESSRPVVLVEYSQGGKAKMAYYEVLPTNGTWRTLSGDCVAGRQLPGPHPFDLVDTPWLKETKWLPTALPPYRDRKLQVWARAAGEFDIYMYYANQSGFDFPGTETPEIGAPVAWLSRLDPAGAGGAHPWSWRVSWPENLESMKIGQTLTVAEGGLPEVWNAASMAVVYPVENQEKTVLLTDPTVERKIDLGCKVSELASIGLTTERGGLLHSYKGRYYFNDVPPALSDRIWIDPSNDTLVLAGKKESNASGVELLHINVLSESERRTLCNLASRDDAAMYAHWCDLVASFAVDPVCPTTMEYDDRNGTAEAVSTYYARDHYALTAMGATNYVVLIENDATNDFCDAGNPVNMHVFKVSPEYWMGRVVTREDPLNKVSQLLGVHYSGTFAGAADEYVFEWRRALPGADGKMPTDYDDESVYRIQFDEKQGIGKTSFAIGEQGDTLANMVNAYWTCRYRAANSNSAAYAVMTTNWSAWCAPPALAEGWVQRVLNNITPFTQRMTDLYENEAETAVSMLAQAGAPYVGDVALNQENLNSVGLIQLYRTILNKAESMSLLQGLDDPEANKQLLLATQRLADLYTVLGDEAYADAVNPTISFGSEFEEIGAGIDIDYGAASSSLFCFDNQVPSLLDEELALLRGRSCENAPGNTVGPYYNRLVWNFTKGITAGEVAYAVNYDISGRGSPVIDENTAAAQFPQGHGDAYGHYLSALQGYYRLMRNPNFTWGTVGMGEMNVADNVVNVDYYDEATFAKAAANLAKTADRTVELTALKHLRDGGTDEFGGGYFDANTNNAFGYGQVANRGAYGALCNWVVANSLLPAEEKRNAVGELYADKGLLRIDRGTVVELDRLSDAVDAIQKTVDRADGGMLLAGIDNETVPFDLTPIGTSGGATHYEQIRARAGKAFDNARMILDRAQEYGTRLRMISEAGTGLDTQLAQSEAEYTARLVAIYGKPYADDIGPSGTYQQGYDGPDIYHFMWMDLEPYGLDSVDDTQVATTVTWKVTGYLKDGSISGITNGAWTAEENRYSLSLSANGLVVKPDSISGERQRSGELQVAYSDFLAAYSALRQRQRLLERANERLDAERSLASAKQNASDALASSEAQYRDNMSSYINKLRSHKTSLAAINFACDLGNSMMEATSAMTSIIGLANDIGIPGRIAMLVTSAAYFIAAEISKCSYESYIINDERDIAKAELDLEMSDRDHQGVLWGYDRWKILLDAADEAAKAAADVAMASSDLRLAYEKISMLISEGESLLGLREVVRDRAVNNIAKMRYSDMFFRKMRNEALDKYEVSFDLARRYTYLAAKTYGYETGSDLAASAAGDALLREIVAARSLGAVDSAGRPIVGDFGDGGLSAVLAKLDANWDALKGQLGIGNPQPYATWFSLRHGLFRILKDNRGDMAWKNELSKYWVADIASDPEFRRHCQPFVSQFGLSEKEPGLIIPFSTTIDFAYNIFGKPLAFDDAQFDSSYFATKIAAAGVWLEGYNEKRAGYTGQSAFSATPNVYLVPVGTDVMRTPGETGAVAMFNVVDQTIPVPWPLTMAEIATQGWLPSFDGETGGADAQTRSRKHPSFRAYYANRGVSPSDMALDAVRLTGRSVWNTRWLLVIPAGTLTSDRDGSLRAFINGLDTDRDGRIDVLPVSDIHLGFKTYSAAGK